jgi:cytochrome c oxidase subunit 2
VLFEEKGCAACHSVDGSEGLGPTMKGVFGRPTQLADGTTVTADATYLESAIRDPNATVVKGYEPLMPEVPLTDDDVERLTEYLRSLS